ncbi:MAG: nitroreductase family protein [Acidimicrobiales bacterium]
MELTEALRRRRMVRSFADHPLDPAQVDCLLALALRAPTAGNARGTAWVVLRGAGETATYWQHTTTPDWRARARRWPGLSRAPVVALALASPGAYVARYAEPDKAGPATGAGRGGGNGAGADGGSGGPALGADPSAWPVPYWFGDAAFATMTLLLGATDEGLGACFLGSFRGEGPLLAVLGVPEGWRLFGAVLIGHPDGADRPSASLDRPGPSAAERVHHGRW